jgi:hypothetical protein
LTDGRHTPDDTSNPFDEVLFDWIALLPEPDDLLAAATRPLRLSPPERWPRTVSKTIAAARMQEDGVPQDPPVGKGVGPMDGEVRLQLSEDGADAERLDALTGYLRDELLQLDVEDVERAQAGDVPPGARAIDVVALGGLVVSLGRTAAGLKEVVAAVRRWLSRGDGVRRTVKIEIDGDTLELSEVTVAEQDRLVDLFVRRHARNEG